MRNGYPNDRHLRDTRGARYDSPLSPGRRHGGGGGRGFFDLPVPPPPKPEPPRPLPFKPLIHPGPFGRKPLPVVPVNPLQDLRTALKFVRRTNPYWWLLEQLLDWYMDNPPVAPQLFNRSRFTRYFGPCTGLEEVQLGDMKTCGLKQVQPIASVAPGTPIRFGTFGQTIGSAGGFGTAQSISHYVENLPYTSLPPVKTPGHVRVPMLPGVLIPALHPEDLPIHAPVPTPRPIPHRFVPRRRPNPIAPPTDQPQWGPGPTPTPRRRYIGSGAGGWPGRNDPRPDPSKPLPPIVIYPPGVKPPPAKPPHFPKPPKPYPPLPSRPPPGTTERKFTISLNNKSVAGRLIGIWGEYWEFIDALYKALPDHLKKPGLTKWQKFELVTRNIQHARIIDVMLEVVFMEAGDWFFGVIGQRAGQAARDLGLSSGLQIGGAQRRFIEGALGLSVDTPVDILRQKLEDEFERYF